MSNMSACVSMLFSQCCSVKCPQAEQHWWPSLMETHGRHIGYTQFCNLATEVEICVTLYLGTFKPHTFWIRDCYQHWNQPSRWRTTESGSYPLVLSLQQSLRALSLWGECEWGTTYIEQHQPSSMETHGRHAGHTYSSWDLATEAEV